MSKRRNTFSRALRQLKSEEIDKKIQLTETLPTNNTMGVFISMPPGAVVSTTTVQRTYWDQASLDLDVDGQSDGKDTTGLFETDGTPKTAMPSGDTSYILGPMSAMYYGWWSGGTTTIGYIRQSDRKMVNLGTISGKLHEWDGSSFNSYGQLTLEHEVWFREVKKKDDAGNDPANANYRAFYPGPPSNTPDAFGRYYCTVTGEPLNRSVTSNVEVPHSPTEKGEISPNDAFSAIMDRIRQGKKLSKAEQEFLRDRNSGQRGWLGNAMENIRNSLSNSVPAALGRALRSLTDPIRYAGQNMFQGNPAGRSAGLSNYWSPDPRTAGTYSRTGNLRGVPGARPGPGGTITTAPRPRNIPRVSRSPLGQPQFKFPKGTSVRKIVTSVADDAAMSAAGRTAATRIGSRL